MLFHNFDTLTWAVQEADAAQGGPACTPFGSSFGTFDRATFALRLPSFLEEHESTPVRLLDSGGTRYFGSGSHPDPGYWRAELHLLYIRHPEFCRSCSCSGECGCPTYTDLWELFLLDVEQEEAPTAELAEQMSAWHDWAFDAHEQGRLTQAQVELCSGPVGRAEVYDRATVGETKIACTRLEGSKLAKDSVVLMRHDGELCAGRVQAFISHAPPGCDGDTSEEPDIALVHWYAWVPEDHFSTDPALGCPLFGRKLADNDPTGNMCFVQQFLPCQLATVPYRYESHSQVAIISRFADFVQALPE